MATKLTNIQNLVRFSFESLSSFDAGFKPTSTDITELDPMTQEEGLGGVGHILDKPGAISKLQEKIDQLPENLIQAVNDSTVQIGAILKHLGADLQTSQYEVLSWLERTSDPDMLSLAATLGGENGHLQVPVMNIFRNSVLVEKTPFAHTLTTLLGEFALLYFDSEDKEQPTLNLFEFSRDGWGSLDELKHQIEIEDELSEAQKLFPIESKIVVSLSWTIAALVSFVDECIFVAEHTPYEDRRRGNRFVLSYGRDTRSIQPFECDSMQKVIKLIQAALANDEITACDLMWMASGIARRPEIHLEKKSFKRPEIQYDVFLSHRGSDSKAELISHLLNNDSNEAPAGVFLDCLCMPRRVINRKFVFENLACSNCISIIDSDNYYSSEWCRKEKWFADQLVKLGHWRVESTDLNSFLKIKLPENQNSEPRVLRVRRVFVLEELIDNQSDPNRSPNLNSLSSNSANFKLERELKTLGEKLDRGGFFRGGHTFEKIFQWLGKPLLHEAADNDFDATVERWCVVCQFLMMFFAKRYVTVATESLVWRSVDKVESVIRHILEGGIAEVNLFIENTGSYLSLLSAVAVFELWYENPGELYGDFIEDEISPLIGTKAIIHNRCVLLDVREKQYRDFNLRIAAVLISNGLAGFGILQNASDPVHNRVVDGRDISVLPCLTMHPGMEFFLS